ncbi:MAG: hypothetical protein ACI82G_002235, partial [Bradymonadia bacterium]
LAQHVVLMDGPEGTIWRIEPPAPAGVSSPAC